MSDELKPIITRVDLQRGRKTIPLTIKSGEVYPVEVTAPAWPAVAEIHLQHHGNEAAIEAALFKLCAPLHITEPDPVTDLAAPAQEWIGWLDLESHNLLTRCVREFAYGFASEKKRAEARSQIGRFLQRAMKPTPSNAPASDSPAPTDGASPGSSPAPSTSAASKPTTA